MGSTRMIDATVGATPHIAVSGLCDLVGVHDAHVIILNRNELERYTHACPGQYAQCRNCDDRKCMDCVMRYVHDVCEDSCPMCCGPNTRQPRGGGH